ncbi:hypothetical protein HXA35_04195 [Bacillus sp. A301a_S52]|nr:hypothetical protein [Bacillus sp. A301a_S52]
MKVKYLFAVCIFSLLINFFSVYNIFMGIASIFPLLILFNINLLVKLVDNANAVPEEKRHFFQRNMAHIGKEKSSRVMNTFGLITGLVLTYLGSVLFTYTTFLQRASLQDYIVANIPWAPLTYLLSLAGFALFSLSLILVTANVLSLRRKHQIFQG